MKFYSVLLLFEIYYNIIIIMYDWVSQVAAFYTTSVSFIFYPALKNLKYMKGVACQKVWLTHTQYKWVSLQRVFS